MRQTFQRAPKGDSADEVGRPHHGGDSAGNGRDNAIGHYGAQKAGPFSADSLSSGASGAFSGSKLPNVIVIACTLSCGKSRQRNGIKSVKGILRPNSTRLCSSGTPFGTLVLPRRCRFLSSDDFDGVPRIGRLREPRPVVDGVSQVTAWCRVV
jgi:hypothetical protein